MKLYHVSDRFENELSLEPRIPKNFMTENGFEDAKTPRVCVADNINGALRAMSANLKGKQFRVFSADIPDHEVYKPTIKEVPDSVITGEHWIKKPVKLTFDKDIEIGESIGDGFDYTYGDNNIATLYDWDFKEKNAQLKMNYKELIEKQAKLNDDIEFNKVQQRVLDNPSNSMIIGHGVGSGKTLSGIAKFEKLKEAGKAKKALVVTPAGLRHNFGNDGIAKFTDSTYNIIGNSTELAKKTGFAPNPDTDYNIVSYEMFRKNPQEILKSVGADTIIADEIHKVRNAGTSTLKSFQDSRDYYKNFIGLTGSVVNNKINDVYNLVDLASRGKHKLGENHSDFDNKFLRRSDAPIYGDVKQDRRPVVGFNNKKLLQEELKKYIDYADDDDVRDIAQIPYKDVSVKKVPLSRQQVKLYKKIISKNPEMEKLIQQKKLETLKDDEVSKAFNSMIESRKLMNSVGSVIPGMSLAESARKTPKTRKLLDDMEKHLSTTPDGQAILLSNMINGGIDVLEAGLKDRGIDYGKFIGKGNEGVTEESRQQDVNDYKDRKKRVMLISGAGAEGISLGDTTWEGVLDGHYNPERMNQMEARGVRARGLSHRPEEDRRVAVNRYIATMPKTMGIFKSPYQTPDEVIYGIADAKAKQNQLLFDLLKENNKEPKKGKFQLFKERIFGKK